MNPLHCRRLFRLAAPLAVALLAACPAPTRTEIVHDAARPLQAGREAVVLFPAFRAKDGSGDAQFLRCLKKELEARLAQRMPVMDAAAFRDALFPWFEAGHAPATIDELNALLARPLVRERIASLGVRYLVNIAGEATAEGFPGIFCGAGYGGAGCLGVMWEDKTHRVDAAIWDLVEGHAAGALSSTTSGRSSGFAFVVPILFLAYTENDACLALADELGRLLGEAAQTPK